jgi:ribosomal 30S subunit maturation factor RimM
MSEKMIRVGKIINCHGVKGELVVLPLTDSIRRFKKLKSVKFPSLINNTKKLLHMFLQQPRFTGK